MSLLIGSLIIGLILSLLALGVFISFRIFNFPDMTVDGSITLGASIAAAFITHGLSPVLATCLAFIAGLLAGSVTGILHTRFKINALLAGILVMTALYSINLNVMGKSNIPLISEFTVFTAVEQFGERVFASTPVVFFLGWEISIRDLTVLIFLLLLITGITLVLYWFFRTNLGTAMRATGNNQQMIRALGVNTSYMIILGLALANGLIGLAGALLAQYQGFADAQMGIGMLVWGLASVIIGEALINIRSLGFIITGTVIGSVFFRMLMAIALRLGLNPNDLKLITALFVLAALVLPAITRNIKLRSLMHDYR